MNNKKGWQQKKTEEKKANIYIYRERESGNRIILSCGLSCQCPHYTVSFSQSVYSENPPVFLGKSLDMLWALWGQLRFRSDFTPACICFQRPQLPPASSQFGGFNLLLLQLHKQIPFFFFGNEALGSQFWFWPLFCLLCGICFPPRQEELNAAAD